MKKRTTRTAAVAAVSLLLMAGTTYTTSHLAAPGQIHGASGRWSGPVSLPVTGMGGRFVAAALGVCLDGAGGLCRVPSGGMCLPGDTPGMCYKPEETLAAVPLAPVPEGETLEALNIPYWPRTLFGDPWPEVGRPSAGGQPGAVPPVFRPGGRAPTPAGSPWPGTGGTPTTPVIWPVPETPTPLGPEPDGMPPPAAAPVSPVPLPPTLPLMLAGLAGLGLGMRRRRG